MTDLQKRLGYKIEETLNWLSPGSAPWRKEQARTTILKELEAEIVQAQKKSNRCISEYCDNYVGGYCSECERLWQN